jgi:hypothetical protein
MPLEGDHAPGGCRSGIDGRVLGGVSVQCLTGELNRLETKPSRAENWYASSVKAVLDSRMQSEVG